MLWFGKKGNSLQFIMTQWQSKCTAPEAQVGALHPVDAKDHPESTQL